jgi:hypothetical protein
VERDVDRPSGVESTVPPSGSGDSVPVKRFTPTRSAAYADRGDEWISSGVPDWVMRPPSMSETRVASVKASSGSCAISTVAPPNVAATSRTSERRPGLAETSTFANGSSSSSSRGSEARARASATR